MQHQFLENLAPSIEVKFSKKIIFLEKSKLSEIPTFPKLWKNQTFGI
jgi:hypothetical protein